MFYILLKNGNIEIGSEQSRDFDRFATLEDLKNSAKKQDKVAEEVYDLDMLLSDIITISGQPAKGNKYSTFFESYAEEKVVPDKTATIEAAKKKFEAEKAAKLAEEEAAKKKAEQEEKARLEAEKNNKK